MAEDIEVDLPEPEKPPKPKKVRATWPKDFDPDKSPPGSYNWKLPDEEWKVVHGENPFLVFDMRGRTRPRWNPDWKTEYGHVGEVIRVDKGCPNCAARAYFVHHEAGMVCIGCEKPLS